MSAPAEIGLDAEYRQLREECGQLRRPELRLIAVRGAEAAEFLQGQLTNDIEGLAAGEGCYALLLDRKGRVRAETEVLCLEPDLLWIRTPDAAFAELLGHLEMYRVGRDAEPEPLEDLTVLSLIGPRVSELLGGVRLGPEHEHREIILAGVEPRLVSTHAGADLILPASALEEVSDRLAAEGAEPVSAAAAEILRVEAGRPAFGAEFGNETIPQEAGLNERAVSFEKGCYIGQETVARLHYKGRPNRHLRRLRSSRPLESGAPVMLGEKEVGRIGTAVLSPAEGAIALAVLRREAEPGATVEVGDGEPARVEEIA